MSKISLTVIIPSKNEEKNIGFCLEPLVGWAEEIIVVDSLSTDDTQKIASDYGAQIIQFEYKGGWPKKRQYVLDTYSFETEWILLLDCDEILSEVSKNEIGQAIRSPEFNGYYLLFKEEFFGKMLRFSVPGLRKLSLFRAGKGKYEMRLEQQDPCMSDIEIHEHVVVEGRTANLKTPVLHRNNNDMSRYIRKHDEYSNYDARVQLVGSDSQLKAKLFGTIEQRRRWLKQKLIRNRCSPIFYFIYLYFIRMGFLDGKPGFYYIAYQCMYLYFVSSKIYEIEQQQSCVKLDKLE